MLATILQFFKLLGKILKIFSDKKEAKDKKKKEVKDDVEKGINSRDASSINRGFGRAKRL